MILLIVSSGYVLASPSLAIDVDEIEFGEIEWDEDGLETFKITNDGDENITGISLSSNAHSDYSLSFDTTNGFGLIVGEEILIEVEVTLKDDPDTRVGEINIGTIQITNDQSVDKSISMNLVSPERFQIIDLDVRVGRDSEGNVKNDTKIDKKAIPGNEIEFSLELENLFDNEDDDHLIEDITVEVKIKDIDDGDDIDFKTDQFEIEAGSKKSQEITLEIPEIVISDTYDVLIIVEGDNAETNEKYEIEWQVRLEVEKNKHDIQIIKYESFTEKLECDESNVRLLVELLNTGEKEEDQVVIEIKNSDLNINEKFRDLQLGKDFAKDAKYEKEINVVIDKEYISKGIYPLTLNVYFDNDKLDDQKNIDLEILDCNFVEEEKFVEVVEEDVVEEVVEVPNVTNSVPNIEISNGGKPKLLFPIVGLLIIVGLFMILILVLLIKKS